MFYVREHNLFTRTTKTIHESDNHEEAMNAAKTRCFFLNQEKPCTSLISVDDDINQVYDYDSMIKIILEISENQNVKDLKSGEVIDTDNELYPKIEIFKS